jgi:hypothetical protein
MKAVSPVRNVRTCDTVGATRGSLTSILHVVVMLFQAITATKSVKFNLRMIEQHAMKTYGRVAVVCR